MINGTYLKELLDEKGFKAPQIAKELKVSPTAVYSWIKGEDNPKEHRLFQLAEFVGLNETEFDRLLGVPETKIYFRKTGLEEAEVSAKKKAKELADTFFKIDDGSYSVEKRFGSIQSEDCRQIAIRIREFLGVEQDEPVLLADVLKELTKFKFNVFFLPLEKLRLSIPTTQSGNKREVAFSAQCDDQFLIVVDTARSKDQILFDICHELTHLALNHPEETTDEQERLCNLVAQELIYPHKFILGRPDIFDTFKSAKKSSYGKFLSTYISLSGSFDWSPDGLCYALIEHGLIKAKDDESRILHSIKNKTKHTRAPLNKLFFKKFDVEDFEALKRFFDEEIFEDKSIYRPFIELKNAASFGNLSPRRLAEILSIDSGDAEELVRSWELELEDENSQDDLNDNDKSETE